MKIFFLVVLVLAALVGVSFAQYGGGHGGGGGRRGGGGYGGGGGRGNLISWFCILKFLLNIINFLSILSPKVAMAVDEVF